jgi:hypothetical protein
VFSLKEIATREALDCGLLEVCGEGTRVPYLALELWRRVDVALRGKLIRLFACMLCIVLGKVGVWGWRRPS